MDIEKVLGLVAGQDVMERAKQLAIINQEKTEHSIMAKIGEHLVEVTDAGEYSCDCEDALYRKRICKHVVKVLLDPRNRDIAEEFLRAVMGGKKAGKFVKFHSSGLKEIDKISMGIPEGYLIALFGPPESGKTILAYQIMGNVIKGKGNLLVLDTERAYPMYEMWLDKFFDGYDIHIVELGKKLPQGNYVYVYQVEDIVELLSLHGKSARVKVSDKGKVELVPDKGWTISIRDTAIYELCENGNVAGIIYDSVTEPVEEFGTAQQNLGARNQAYKWVLTTASKLVESRKMFGIAIFHETVNPTNPRDPPKIKGGTGVKYNIKMALYISRDRTSHTPKTESRPKHVREVWVARHFNLPPWVEYGEIELTAQGFKDWRR